MNIKIESDFQFSVVSIQYSATGELSISLSSDVFPNSTRYQYSASLGSGQAEEKPTISLLEYTKSYAASANIKPQTKDTYRLMCRHLEAYGDTTIEKVSTAYLQDYIQYLQSQGLKPGSVRLYFQKLACVLHDAYKNGLFDDRILQRVKRPKREQKKRCFLTEKDLKNLTKTKLSDEYNNIQTMFLFSCMTGLRYGDVQGLRWKDVKRNGKHLQLEFHQQKTDTYERLPLCAEAEALLRAQKRSGEYVFKEETNQKVNVVLKRWCKKAKIKKPVSFHSARHTFCVLLLTKDVPIYTVQQLMCHSDIADAGTTTFTYDPAGNLMKETNPLGGIFYSYTYYRPKEKRYSYMTGNDVTYTYGTSGNDIGRPVRITDGSGSYECHYDKLGNVTDEIRTIALPYNSDEVYRFHMDYTYDSWGRMLSMTYPDGEEITYTYQWGGDLRSMHGVKNSNHRTYIREIRYNPFGQKKQVNYGNGTQVQYSYDTLHRLANLRSYDSLGNLMQKLDYTFDSASNITHIKNFAGIVNSLGGDYENNYRYDRLHRLTSSDGSGGTGSYDMNMEYTPSGRITKKHRTAQSRSVSETVDIYYGYCNEYQPHAVKRMFDHRHNMLFDLRWDEAGNLGQVSMSKPGEMFDAGRFLFWTEDNRMHTAVNGKYYSYYAYDYGGERRLKLVGVNSSVDVNAEYMTAVSTLNEPTLYPSAYMVLTNKGYTKHYYAGTERVAARLGGGGNALHHVIENDGKLQTKADSLFDQCLEQVNSRVLKENDLECIMRNKYAKEEFGYRIDGTPYQTKADISFNHRLFKEMAYLMADDPVNVAENDVYFYHSDHLGSASWITDSAGIAVQHLQYLPYGEPYIDQRAAGTTYSERFRFTGKERDKETGYGYFGARYMDHELMTMWLSVDPMADKYPSISPYAYCAWNPVRLIDPDGMDIWIINGADSFQYTVGMSPDGYEGFSKQAITSLNEIYQTDEGKLMLDFLVDADIVVEISYAYVTENYLSQLNGSPDAFFNVETKMPGSGLGFSCDIKWNSAESGGQMCVNGMDKNITLDLADEIAHAYDAGNGWAYRYEEINGVIVDEGLVNGYDKREFQAAYRVNVIRSQMGNTNYRTTYFSNPTIANKETFFKPSWYTLKTTDNESRITFDIP